MSKTKKILIGILPALAIAGVVYAAPYTLKDLFVKLGLLQKQVDALVVQVEEQNAPKFSGISAFDSCFINSLEGSTTPLVLTSGATTTSAVCDTRGRGKGLSLLIRYGSVSSSTSALAWEYEWSALGDPNSHWFKENTSALQAAGIAVRSHGAGTTTHNYTPVGEGTSTIAVKIDNVLARYLRVNFGATSRTGVGIALPNFWGIITRQEDQN